MAEESELSKRIDDLRGDMNARFGIMDQRFGELRADMNRWIAITDTRFGELRADMNRWMGVTDTRFGELRADMNARFTGMEQRLKTLNWSVTVWFSILTLLIVLFRFLRF